MQVFLLYFILKLEKIRNVDCHVSLLVSWLCKI